MVLLRRVIGDALRSRRQSQHRTLREVSTAANVSLGYLSEIERGQKEASSELLASICDALELPLSELMSGVALDIRHVEPARDVPVEPAVPEPAVAEGAPREPAVASAASHVEGGRLVPSLATDDLSDLWDETERCFGRRHGCAPSSGCTAGGC